MLGKAVKVRHCPATVTGVVIGRLDHCENGKIRPIRPVRKSGDRFLDIAV
jgi:hypothetical protein